MLNRGPGGQLSAGWWLSLPHSLVSKTQSGVPRVPSAGWWLSLPHLVSNSSDLQLTRGPEGPFCWVVAFPTTTCLSPTHWLPVLTELYNSSIGYSIFDRHQAEITVMQFTGHSLPVHQSMSVPWDFYLVPFFQPSPPTQYLPISAIGMYDFLPVHHFGMVCFAGSKVNIQHFHVFLCIVLTIQININHLFKHCKIIKQFFFKLFNLA